MPLSDLAVFVYGTLKPGGRYWPEFCAGKLASKPVPAKIRGELYDLKLGYPGLKLRGDGWVHGHILTFKAETDFLHLDELEGYDPKRPDSENEYNRQRVPAYSSNGESVGTVWAYEISDQVMANCKAAFLPDGNWAL